jgi:hypothetical protein
LMNIVENTNWPIDRARRTRPVSEQTVSILRLNELLVSLMC